MFIHNVFIANSFKKGDRFAYDIVIPAEDMDNELNDSETLRSFLVNVYDQIGSDTTITTHIIPTDSADWQSVVARDTFFSDIKIIKSEKNFIKNLSYNSNLTYRDVAYFVLSLDNNSDIDHKMVDKIVKDIEQSYYEKFGEKLYEEESDKKLGWMSKEAIDKYANIIADRVISARNGFSKYDFILQCVKNYCEKYEIE